jgi:hypothetical protein
MIHDSALEIIPLGAHLGKAPRLRMRRVVTRLPEGVVALEITSQETTWDAYGLGYLRKYAKDTMDHGSLAWEVSLGILVNNKLL